MREKLLSKRYLQGSLLFEALLALVITSSALLSCISALNLYQKIKPDYHHLQDLISVYQLEHLFLIAEEVEINEFEVSFYINEEEFLLEYVNSKIIISPGTQIVFFDVSDYYFQHQDNYLFIYIYRQEKEIKYSVLLT